MLNVTETARGMLDGILTDALGRMDTSQIEVSEPGLRLVISEGQAGLTLDFPQEGDEVVEENGHPILIVDQMIGEALDGATIDVEKSDEGDRLTIRPSEQDEYQES
jgi:Fe-S cluster assembly iron-binding protein IscA